MSSSKETTKAVNLGGTIIGAAFQPLATFRSQSKQTSVSAFQLGRRKCLGDGQRFEHLKAGGDGVKNLKGDPVKNEQHIGDDGLDWWKVTRSCQICLIHKRYHMYQICKVYLINQMYQIYQIYQIGDPLMSWRIHSKQARLIHSSTSQS